MAKKKQPAPSEKPRQRPAKTTKDMSPDEKKRALRKAAQAIVGGRKNRASSGRVNSAFSAKSLKALEIANQAISLKRDGLTYRAIANKMGCAPSTVFLNVRKITEKIVGYVLGNADALIQDELEQDDVILQEIERRLCLALLSSNAEIDPLDLCSNEDFVSLVRLRHLIKTRQDKLLGLYTYAREEARSTVMQSDRQAAAAAFSTTEQRINKLVEVRERLALRVQSAKLLEERK